MRSFEIEYKGETYTCCLNRNIIRRLERSEGFNVSENQPVSLIYTLFYGSLLTKHPRISKQFAEQMLDEITAIDDKGESEYDFTEIGEELIEMAKPCYANDGTTKTKKSIKKI